MYEYLSVDVSNPIAQRYIAYGLVIIIVFFIIRFIRKKILQRKNRIELEAKMAEETKDTGTAWNMATATLQRIDSLLTATTIDAAEFKLNNWLIGLKGLNREIWPWLTDEEQEKIKEKTKEIDMILKNWMKTNPYSYKKGEYPIGMFDSLDILDIYIRCKLKAYGFLLPEKDDPNYAMKQ